VTPSAHRRLVSYPDAAWLPPGGRAEVVLAGPDAAPPEPTCLVRALVTRSGAVLTRARGDGRRDIPTRRVGEEPVAHAVRSLLVDTMGDLAPARLLGWVRNVVEGPVEVYEWPTPEAHFAVWHCEAPAALQPEGRWLEAGRVESQLGRRHWWPLGGQLGLR
jgi:hypothetical protein